MKSRSGSTKEGFFWVPPFFQSQRKCKPLLFSCAVPMAGMGERYWVSLLPHSRFSLGQVHASSFLICFIIGILRPRQHGIGEIRLCAEKEVLTHCSFSCELTSFVGHKGLVSPRRRLAQLLFIPSLSSKLSLCLFSLSKTGTEAYRVDWFVLGSILLIFHRLAPFFNNVW